MPVDPVRGPGFIVPAAHMPGRVNETDADRRRQQQEDEEETPHQKEDTIELHESEPVNPGSAAPIDVPSEGSLDLEC